jgi:hypothetical protein
MAALSQTGKRSLSDGVVAPLLKRLHAWVDQPPPFSVAARVRFEFGTVRGRVGS